MLAYLKPVVAFTDLWHASPWSIATLAPALGAELAYLPSGRGILGISTDTGAGYRISVAERLEGLPLGGAVLYHEAGHLLTRIQGLNIPFCNARWSSLAAEVPAWQAAGLLSVSTAQSVAYDLGDISLRDLARGNGLPGELIELGLALRRPDSPGHGRALALWLIAMTLDYSRFSHPATQRTGRGLARST